MEPPLVADDFSGAGEGGEERAGGNDSVPGAGRAAGLDCSLMAGTSGVAGSSAGVGGGAGRNFFLKKLNIE
jgi:hypothetical protein